MDNNNFVLSFSVFLILFRYNVNAAFDELATIPYNDGFCHVFGNVVPSFDGNSVQISLNKNTGSGFNTSNRYKYGLFSAKIKLPSNYTAGVCVTFYTTNQQVFGKTHDELDFEFLGNIAGKQWKLQTNLYGNGSTDRGREERYSLWFDPTQEYHRYSILWTRQNVIFYIDEIPIREVLRNEEMGSEYPSKPMSVYATIWDASPWATGGAKGGGHYPVKYEYAPFVAQYKDLVVKGCSVDSIQDVSNNDSCSYDLEAQDYAALTPMGRLEMRRFRRRYMHYSYCYNTNKYNIPLPECNITSDEKQMFNKHGELKFVESHRRNSRRRSRTSTPIGGI